MKPRIWLSSPHMGGNEQKYINEAFEQNWIAPLGPNVTLFEKRIEEKLGGQHHVAALASGTSALHLALIQLGVGHGDVVICQSMTFSASANPILYQGAIPVFIDSEPDTWNICPDALELALTNLMEQGIKPKAIIAVHLYGMAYKAVEISAIANRFGVPIVEDSAEALGSTYKGQACGTFGDFGVLSFNGNKIITTSSGGALVCSSEAAKKRAIFLATQARDDAPHYQHSEVGYNYRLSNISAGIGCGQMEVLDHHVNKRRQMNAFYKEIFAGTDIKVHEEPSELYFSNHWLSCILTNSFEERERIRLYLADQNIESRPLWKPMHMQPVFQDFDYYGSDVAEKLFEVGLCLPSGSNLTEEDKERIADSLTHLIAIKQS
jgi:dTDP-4-amino-4,6-dideoxygalactose transaminase